MFSRRLQILLDEARYRRVAARAREQKTSVAAIIRDAIDVALPDDPNRKRAAGRALLAAPPIPVPETLDELEAESEAAHVRGL